LARAILTASGDQHGLGSKWIDQITLLCTMANALGNFLRFLPTLCAVFEYGSSRYVRCPRRA
jgi:hypothetical protein